MFGLSDEHLTEIRKVFADNGLSVRDVLVFGSRVLGNYRYNSDIDLAYKAGEGNVAEIREKINKARNYLEEETFLPYKFDILIYEEIENDKLRQHIDHFGKSLG